MITKSKILQTAEMITAEWLQLLQEAFSEDVEKLSIVVHRIRKVEADQKFLIFEDGSIGSLVQEHQQHILKNGFAKCSCASFKFGKGSSCKHLFNLAYNITRKW